jgi:peptidoglycan/LPS O-acetylase OafA/YrhL
MAAAIFSSAAGYFGLIGAAVMVSAMRIEPRRKLAVLAVIGVAFIAFYLPLRPPSHALIADWHRDALYILTGLGGTLWSSPVGLFSFPINVRSVTGAVLLLVLVVALWRAWTLDRMSEIAFPLGLVAFGLLALAAMALNREYLGNWHLQFVAPAVCGIFMCAWVVSEGKQISLGLVAAMVILVGAIVGARAAFVVRGPAYHAYVRSIERYILSFTPDTSQPKPYPPRPPQWDVDRTMIDFLAKRHHVLFAGAGS